MNGALGPRHWILLLSVNREDEGVRIRLVGAKLGLRGPAGRGITTKYARLIGPYNAESSAFVVTMFVEIFSFPTLRTRLVESPFNPQAVSQEVNDHVSGVFCSQDLRLVNRYVNFPFLLYLLLDFNDWWW